MPMPRKDTHILQAAMHVHSVSEVDVLFNASLLPDVVVGLVLLFLTIVLFSVFNVSLLPDVVVGPDDDPPVDMLLERYSFEYILKKVRQHQLINLFRPFVHSSTLDHKLKDVAQDIHIKFWQCLEQKKPIQNYEAYIARMVRNELITEIRRCTRHGSKLTKTLSEHEGMLEDTIHLQPVEEVEQGIAVIQRMHEAAIAVTKLPRKQRLAMTCSLLEEDENLPLMKDILKLYGVNTEVAWPQDKKAKQRLQANLSPARRAIAKHLHMDYTPQRCSRRPNQ